ncbi:hypothetical protein [Endomicrobium proavitum]|uniref:Cell division protein FtsX n=1 Tax=Endomicrobium proavitum TaxID=1408281 RepID=A0A0G3WFW9_9BACT|nr:hypothetical protein [Endomicrobium proavitum]AKL97511.1 conserved membrane protein of unknown function [Endomicrobium proavitum]
MNENAAVKAWSKVVKFFALAAFCAFSVLFADHYYRVDKYAKDMSENLAITVFLNKNVNNSNDVASAIESLGYVNVNEYVSAEQSYYRAVKKNPFLKDVSVPGDKDSFAAYFKVSPNILPTDQFLIVVRNAMAQITGVNDVVYDADGYKKYIQAKRTLELYEKISLIFALTIFALFIIKILFLYYGNNVGAKKLSKDFVIYLLSAAAGFLAVWSAGIFVFYPLLIKEAAVFGIIAVTAALGIIFKD